MGLKSLLGAGFWAWHSKWEGKLTASEIDHYMAISEKLASPPDKSKEIIPRICQWAEANVGKPVYMFNLIRYFPELRRFPGAPGFNGTPQESNAHCEKSLTRLWLSHAAYLL